MRGCFVLACSWSNLLGDLQTLLWFYEFIDYPDDSRSPQDHIMVSSVLSMNSSRLALLLAVVGLRKGPRS